ncbi:hypothetical protein XELAEV_18029302mg [Xenopus laevis]|uniref:Uncharacterized protein n=1 Tax=Xenopus laevis TaxID=8355 RepID=A0A974CT50_XENLA|nr:hypothetical protein XELAEV_18029302mg [Xenopus laevis]
MQFDMFFPTNQHTNLKKMHTSYTLQVAINRVQAGAILAPLPPEAAAVAAAPPPPEIGCKLNLAFVASGMLMLPRHYYGVCMEQVSCSKKIDYKLLHFSH